MHQCPRKSKKAIGRAGVYYARAAHAFRVVIECRHCILRLLEQHVHVLDRGW